MNSKFMDAIYKPLKRRIFILSNQYGTDHLAYWLYALVCRAVPGRETYGDVPEAIDVQGAIRTFNKKGILIVPALVDDSVIDGIRLSMFKSLEHKDTVAGSNFAADENASFIERLKDKFLRNIIFYYKYPRSYCDSVTAIQSPVKNIEGLKDVIWTRLLPVVNVLMGSRAEVVRTWAYRTNNIDGKETFNVNSNLHLDGDVSSSVKCIVYLGDVTEENGPFCYIDPETQKLEVVTGSKGTAIFFKSSAVLHKGSNTLEDERYVFSFLSHPSVENVLHETDVTLDFIRKTVPFLPSSDKASVR